MIFAGRRLRRDKHNLRLLRPVCFLFGSRQVLQEQVHHPFGGYERTDFVIQNLLLRVCQHVFYRRVVIECFTERVVNAFVHPILGLFVALVVEVTVLFGEFHIFSDHVPDFFDP